MSYPLKYLLTDPFLLIPVPQEVPETDRKKQRREKRARGRNWRPTWSGGRSR